MEQVDIMERGAAMHRQAITERAAITASCTAQLVTSTSRQAHVSMAIDPSCTTTCTRPSGHAASLAGAIGSAGARMIITGAPRLTTTDASIRNLASHACRTTQHDIGNPRKTAASVRSSSFAGLRGAPSPHS